METPKIKIYGFGWVGKAMWDVFPTALVQDPSQGMFESKIADIGIICVPTPNLKNGELDMSIVEDVIKNAPENLFLIRSATQPGTADRLENKYGVSIVTQPEYLGESVAHPLLDETRRDFIILGGRPENRRKIIELYQIAYNANIRIRQVSNLEAEVIKLSENRAIMFRVLEAQELYDACEAAGVDYYVVREAVYGDDPRMNLWWTFVYPNKRGAKSKCIPKDPYAWAAWAKNSELTDALLKYNEKLIQ